MFRNSTVAYRLTSRDLCHKNNFDAFSYIKESNSTDKLYQTRD